MQKLTTMFNIFVGISRRGGCTISKARNTHKRAAAPQHATDHGDRDARGSSGSCLANGPGGCRIFANYCCSVRVCVRGKICGLTRRQHLEKNTLSRSQRTKHPFSVGFPILEIVRTGICLHMHVHGFVVRRILYRSRSMAYIGVP